MRASLTLLLLALWACLTAQTLTGTVVDETDQPLVGVSLLVPGTTTGTVTDLDGVFSLAYDADSVEVEFSYVGYNTFRRMIYADRPSLIRFSAPTELLDEVVVIGHSVAARSKATVSAVTVAKAYHDVPTGAAEQLPAAGQLTAGENNDFSKWELWEDISQMELAEYRDVWHFYPDRRYTVQLTHPDGSPAVDVPVTLSKPAGEVWAARTDNRGRAELWDGLYSPDSLQRTLSLSAVADGKRFTLPTAFSFRSGINTYEIPLPCDRPATVDVVFAVDATGSMGDEIRYLQSELTDVITRSGQAMADAELRTAAVFYRDSSDAYVTRAQGFSARGDRTVDWVREQRNGGGGDTPEAADAALLTALDSLAWSPRATARLLFLVLDAPPHDDPGTRARLQAVVRRAARRGVRIIPVVCSGMEKDGEYLMRSVALATNGTYVFLTDDSGIGGSHLKPTTDEYDVELFNDLLVRLITSYGAAPACGETPARTPRRRAGRPPVFVERPLKAFPNPTLGPVTVRAPRNWTGTLEVIDGGGKLLLRQPATERRTDVDLSGLASGTYYLRLVAEDGSAVARVVLR